MPFSVLDPMPEAVSQALDQLAAGFDLPTRLDAAIQAAITLSE